MHKDPIELARALGLKRIRQRVRNEASLRCDIILNSVEDEYHKEFNSRVLRGEPYELLSDDGWIQERVSKHFPALPR